MAIVALLVVFVAPILMAYLPLEEATALLITLLRWVIAIVLLSSGLWTVYRFGPNRRMNKLIFVSWGVLFVIIFWLAASWALSYYMSNFPQYHEIYGSIGAVVALLIWFYLSAYLVLWGAALNAVNEQPLKID
jgi:membrane protein